eukprot:TRINITY_DN1185_c0_g2_i1.p1 TRINITY_DN1185_c0_g2~~TRINITY_DN1185_c0_g2_i1.p1  ORF type:complete len:1243 (+),score=457.53 TRINITY_DN1185_c0_g2_i1:72-3800(+)
MFVYLSKKIAIPNGVRLKSVAWNAEAGWITCGGCNGLLKVLKLDLDRGKTTSNLSMNQTLDGHEGNISVVGWNEQYRKLTSSDENGLIIVWMMHKGMWFEEMINNRNKSVVRDLCWTFDGQKICIAYEDGAVIVGSVDGNRLWGRELRSGGKPLQLSHVQWSPDGKSILFGTAAGQVHRYDASTGNCVAQLTSHCVEASSTAKLIGVTWHSHATADFNNLDSLPPTLAICYDNGRCQLMRHEMDDKPVLIDTGMAARYIRWNCQGTVLAIAGQQSATLSSGDRKEVAMVQFYDTSGTHLQSMKVPGSAIASLSWEGNGMRLALAVDSFIYFANVRPDYKWGYFQKTLVYAYVPTGRSEYTCVFWNTHTAEKHLVKNVSKLVDIAAGGDSCCLARRDDTMGQYVLTLCNAIGAPLEIRHIDFEPTSLCMSDTHIVAAGEELIYVWQYRSVASKADALDPRAANARRQESKERQFHVDDVVVPDGPKGRPNTLRTTDQICSACISPKFILVGRETGIVHMYLLPDLAFVNKFQMTCRPQKMAMNCSSTRMSVIDVAGLLTLYDLPAQDTWSLTVAPTQPLHGVERKDVWDMRWSADDEQLFAMMEKTRMYVFRGTSPEEPVPSAATLCSFEDLKIKGVILDEIMQDPEHPLKDCAVDFDTKALRDTTALLNTTLEDAWQFIEDNPHPRLWTLLSEKALEKLDFVMAEKAFVKCQDYQGLQFLKRLHRLDNDKTKQRAEIAAYFHHFDDAERLYRTIDRRDLAAELRMRLGDWFKVVQLVQEGGLDDVHIQEAWSNIGDYYADRQKWSKAVQYYNQAKEYGKLITYYSMLEDFKGLQGLVETLPGGSALLVELGNKFVAVGLFHDAVSAFLKADRVKMAVDACIEMNQWAQAVQLAEKFKIPEVSGYIAKYAGHMVEKGELGQALELYRKAESYVDCAKLLSTLGQKAAKARKTVQAKKYHVLAAINLDKYKQKMLSGPAQQGDAAVSMVDALLTTDQATASDRTLANAWRGAEAYHFFLLAQEQLSQQQTERAMVTAMRLCEYDDVLDEVDVYSLIALAAYLNRSYSVCSKAFTRLEDLEARGVKHGDDRGATEATSAENAFVTLDATSKALSRSMGSLSQGLGASAAPTASDSCYDFTEASRPFHDLAFKIFTRHPPSDTVPTVPCWKCKAPNKEWHSVCTSCGVHFNVCVVSGRTIISDSDQPQHRVEACGRCKHKMYKSELTGKRWRHCVLCHSLLNVSER